MCSLTILSYLILVTFIHCQEIKCGQTKTGRADRLITKRFTFKADQKYTKVTLNACLSEYDTILTVSSFDNPHIELAQADDSEECKGKNDYASIVSIPENEQIIENNQYIFELKGYDSWSYGNYNVELICKPESIPTSTSIPSDQCIRKREAWHLLTDSQRSLYIDGFKEIANKGILQQFVKVHGLNAEHRNSAFLPWHRYFLWEIETQIRSLGGRFTCFSLPYWDWTSEVDQYEYDIPNWFILNSGLGSAGIGDRYKVEGINFGEGNYNPYNLGYLKRKTCRNKEGGGCSWIGSTASQLMDKITEESYYFTDPKIGKGYGKSLEASGHDFAHIRIGGNGHLGSTARACDDPIFWLLHSFVDYQYTLWQDCRNHEQVDLQSINSQMYDGDNLYKDSSQIMDFGLLQNNDIVGDWIKQPFCLENNIKIRDMHSNIDWNVIYDKGDFFHRANVERNSVCNGNINNKLFIDSSRRRLAQYQKNKTRSQYSEYSQDLFDRLNIKVGANKKSLKQNVELFKLWAQMDCEYLTMESKCERPKYYDDCNDMIIFKQERNYGRYYYDINITLKQLIDKVGNVQCMIDTRKEFYDWAYQTGNLLGLCRGDYDTFCDHQFNKKQQIEDQCLLRIERKRNENEQLQRNRASYSGMSDYLENVMENDYSSISFSSNDKFTQFEEILISACLNGLIISSVLSLFICFYFWLNSLNANNKS